MGENVWCRQCSKIQLARNATCEKYGAVMCPSAVREKRSKKVPIILVWLGVFAMFLAGTTTNIFKSFAAEPSSDSPKIDNIPAPDNVPIAVASGAPVVVDESPRRLQAAIDMCKGQVAWWASSRPVKASYSLGFYNAFAVGVNATGSIGGSDGSWQFECIVLDENGTARDRERDRVIGQPFGANAPNVRKKAENINLGEEFAKRMCERKSLEHFDDLASAKGIYAVAQGTSIVNGREETRIKVELDASDKFDVRVDYSAQCRVYHSTGAIGDGRPFEVVVMSIDRDLSKFLNPDRIQ